MKTHFNTPAAEYEAQRSGCQQRRRRDEIDRALRRRGGAVHTVVELGCGTGGTLAEVAGRYPEARCVGVDIDAELLAFAAGAFRLPNLRYERRDVARDGGPCPAPFVFSLDLIHHLHDPLPFFRAVAAMLEPGGAWLVVEPNIFHPYVFYSQERMRRAGFDEDHFRPWRAAPLFRAAGLRVRRRYYLGLFPDWLRRPPRWLGWAERLLEGAPCLGASVVYHLEKPGGRRDAGLAGRRAGPGHRAGLLA